MVGRYEIIEWFAARVGDVIPNEHYQVLFIELVELAYDVECGESIDKAIEIHSNMNHTHDDDDGVLVGVLKKGSG